MTDLPAPARLTAQIQGRVQMVGFRVFAEQTAARIERETNTEITGWVRNLPDGSTVEVVAEGDRSALNQLLEELQIGPPTAIVRTVKADWTAPTGDLTPFELRH